jgi:hypothetical protein
MPINLGPQDVNLAVSIALPAAGQSATTNILDLQSIAPQGNAWREGRFVVSFPALPENNAGAGITVALQAAPPSLIASQPAPALPVPGAFVTPAVGQTLTIPAVANGGSAASNNYFTLAFDANGSPYQFYQFLVTVPAQVATQGEVITIAWVYA